MDKIGIVENNYTVSPALQDALRPYTRSGFLHLEAWGNDEKKQNGGFARCFRRMREDHDWVAFFDADEFLVVLEECVPEPLVNELLPSPLLSCSALRNVSDTNNMKSPITCRGKSIKDLLDDYRGYPGVSVHWIIFGSGEREKRPVEGGVLRWYLQCRQQPERFIKTIASSYHLLSFDLHPHNFFYRCGFLQSICSRCERRGEAQKITK